MSKYISSMATGVLFLHVKNNIHLLKTMSIFYIVSDLDPDWIEIKLGLSIRIQEGKNTHKEKGRNFVF